MKYEVILFDADETLFDFKKSEREAFRKAMIDIGIEYDEIIILKYIMKLIKRFGENLKRDL